MSEKLAAGCTRPGSGPVEEVAAETHETIDAVLPKKGVSMIQVGKKAPDFTAPGFHRNAFINETLSEHLGKWVVLCFYPGDFTFV